MTQIRHPALGTVTRYATGAVESGFVYLDDGNTLWTDLPGNAWWSQAERSMMVDTDPVTTCGDMYILPYILEDYV